MMVTGESDGGEHEKSEREKANVRHGCNPANSRFSRLFARAIRHTVRSAF